MVDLKEKCIEIKLSIIDYVCNEFKAVIFDAITLITPSNEVVDIYNDGEYRFYNTIDQFLADAGASETILEDVTEVKDPILKKYFNRMIIN